MKATVLQAFLPRLALAGALAALGGCAATTPDWDQTFGEATRGALAQQISHPEAGQSVAPVLGRSGPAASAAYARYLKSLSEPAPPATFTIGVSGAK